MRNSIRRKYFRSAINFFDEHLLLYLLRMIAVRIIGAADKPMSFSFAFYKETATNRTNFGIYQNGRVPERVSTLWKIRASDKRFSVMFHF